MCLFTREVLISTWRQQNFKKWSFLVVTQIFTERGCGMNLLFESTDLQKEVIALRCLMSQITSQEKMMCAMCGSCCVTCVPNQTRRDFAKRILVCGR